MRASFDERVCALMLWHVYASGYRHDLPIFLKAIARGNERATFIRRLNHYAREAQTRDNAVSSWKISALCFCIRRELAYEATVFFYDFMRKMYVVFRVQSRVA